MATALAHAHKSGVVHRDVKPGNVMVRDDGEPMLTDFGLAARAGEGKMTEAGQVIGTPHYMAPEQWQGEAVPASDQYALGCLFFELLTGETAFAGQDLGHFMFLHIHQAAPSPRQWVKEVPRDLETICLKCLEKEPGQRYPDCQALADDLRRWQEGTPIVARQAGPVERLVKWARRNPAMAGMLALVMLTLVVGASVATVFGLQARHAAREKDKAVAKVSEEAKAKGKALAEAQEATKEATKQEKLAKDNEREATKQERLAKDRGHQFQIELAMQVRKESDWERMRQLLQEMERDYGQAWETTFVRNLWIKYTFPLKVVAGHTSAVLSVAFCADGKRILTGSYDKTAMVWDAHTGQEILTLKGHTGFVTSVAWNTDGKRILTGSGDTTARVWDAVKR